MPPLFQLIVGTVLALIATAVAWYSGWWAKDGWDAIMKPHAKAENSQPNSISINQSAGDGGVNLATTGPNSPIILDNRKTDIEYTGRIVFSSKNQLIGEAYETRLKIYGKPVAPVFQFAAKAPSVFHIEVTKFPGGTLQVLRHGIADGMAFLEIAHFGGEYEILLRSKKPEEFEFQTAVPE